MTGKQKHFSYLKSVASGMEFPTYIDGSTLFDLYEVLTTFSGCSSLLQKGMEAPTFVELEEAHVLLESLIVYPETFQTEFNMRKDNVWYYSAIAEFWHPIVFEMLLRKVEQNGKL